MKYLLLFSLLVSTNAITWDGQTYDLCAGTDATVTYNGDHDIQEISQTGYDAYDVAEHIGAKILDFPDPFVQDAEVTVSGLGAPEGTTRYFICTTHTSSKFKTTCAAAAADDGGDDADDGAAAGATGPTGPAGADGADGADGAVGAQGPQGEAGADGAQGPAGADGADGADGAQGPAGPAGPAGADGVDGQNGQNGVQGPQGLNGDAGADGTDGADGKDGADGTNGKDGEQWILNYIMFGLAGSSFIMSLVLVIMNATKSSDYAPVSN